MCGVRWRYYIRIENRSPGLETSSILYLDLVRPKHIYSRGLATYSLLATPPVGLSVQNHLVCGAGKTTGVHDRNIPAGRSDIYELATTYEVATRWTGSIHSTYHQIHIELLDESLELLLVLER